MTRKTYIRSRLFRNDIPKSSGGVHFLKLFRTEMSTVRWTDSD